MIMPMLSVLQGFLFLLLNRFITRSSIYGAVSVNYETDVPDQGLLCDLLWSDPDKDVLGWGENDRGVSFTFGAEVVAKFLHKHDLDLICRAHQVLILNFTCTLRACV